MRLPAKPPAWLEELDAYLTEEKKSKLSLAAIKKHWGDFRSRKTEAEEEEGGGSGEKRARPTPEESLGRAVGKLSKRKKGGLDLDRMVSSVRENCGDDKEQNLNIFKSIGSGLQATQTITELYSDFESRADAESVSDGVRAPVAQMATYLSS